MKNSSIKDLILCLSRLPGLGPRSGRRAALHLLKNKQDLLVGLQQALQNVSEAVRVCSICGNFDTEEPCHVCQNPERDSRLVCVVAEVEDVWALERSGAFKGMYHVLGGVLSAMDGITPDRLALTSLMQRLESQPIQEVVLALSATIEGQTTAHYIADRISSLPHISLTKLAHGVPVGGELDYLDDGTLTMALKSRRPF